MWTYLYGRAMSNTNKWSLDSLLETDPYDLENLVAHLFRNMGYTAEVTSKSKDGGVDVDLKLEHFGISHRWLVQVKRYSNPVGVKEVREYSSLCYREKVDGVIIVTTSTFTEDAYREALEHNVKLIEGQLLVSMLDHYCDGDGQTRSDKGNNTNISSSAVLKTGESVYLKEPVSIGNDRFMMFITNKNLYFEKTTGGVLSKKTEIARRIDVKDIVGFSNEQRSILLVVGKKRFETIHIKPKTIQKVLDTFEYIRSDYMRGESLLRIENLKDDFIILTNKRLAVVSSEESAELEIKLKDIIGSEVIGSGLFSRKKLIVSESSDTVNKHSIGVGDAQSWKITIDESVRSI